MPLSLSHRDGFAASSHYREPAQISAVRHWLFAILFTSVFLQRFAVPVGGTEVPLSLFVSLAAIGMLLLRGQLNVDPFRAALVLLFTAYASVGAMFNGGAGTWTSAVFAIAMYIPFAFMLRPRDALFMDCVRAYRSMMLICAILGIAQFLLQFVISSNLLFTFEGYLPPRVLLDGFSTLLPIAYGSPLNRSNGFLMLEPSAFSQFVALAIIIEILFYQSKWRLAVYSAALLFSYSGTGLIALVVVPAILIARRSYGTIVTLALFAALVVATPNVWHMSVMEERTTEFDSTDTSAHARFLAPAELIGRYLVPNSHDLLFGVGPGSLHTYQNMMPYETHDPSWAKVLFEYGLIGSMLFWAMFLPAVFSQSPSVWLSIALAIGFLSFGGEFLDPRLQGLLLVFCVLPKQAAFASARALQGGLIVSKTA